jgi:hypothetical protein
MAAIADRVLNQFSDPYTFPSRHERMTAPYNYYEFGQAYVRELVDFSKSLVGHADRFARVAAQLAAGDNVVLLANHQTEADPAVWALLLEGAFPGLATDVAYVAGFTGLGVGSSRFGALTMLDLLHGHDTERTRLAMVREKPLPYPPEPLRSLAISLTKRALARADRNQGRRNLWLRLLDALGVGFDS